MNAVMRLALLLLVVGSGSTVLADSPPPGWDSVAGKWEGQIVIWRGDEPSIEPMVMRVRHAPFGTLELPFLGCEVNVKQVEDVSDKGAAAIYRVDSEDGMCGIVTVSVRVRGERAEVLAENDGSVRPIGVLFKYWNGREWFDQYLAGHRSTPTRTSRSIIIDLVQSMKWKPVIPDEAYEHFAAGNAVLLAERADEKALTAAEQPYLEALRLAPWWAEPHYNLALVYQALGRADDAHMMYNDYLSAAGLMGAAGTPHYDDFSRWFQAEVASPPRQRGAYEAWAAELVAYMKSIAHQWAALKRARDDYRGEVQDYTNRGCGRDTHDADLWRECKARHLELSEWNEQLNQWGDDLEKGDAFIEEWVDEAFRAYNAKEYDRARDVVEPLAAGGSMNAQFLLGRMYRYGDGVPESRDDAVRWFQKAAANGSNKAKKELEEL